MWHELSDQAHWIGERLAVGSLQGGVAIALAWAACRWIPRVPAWLQAWIWWLAALKLALALLPLPLVPVPLLPATEARLSALRPERVTLAGNVTDAGSRNEAALPLSTRVDWLGVAALVWLAGLAVHGVLLVRGAIETRRLVRHATPLAEGDLAAVSQIAVAVGLTRLPRVCKSHDIRVPQVVGFHDPVVVLPAGEGGRFAPAEWRMAVGHELMHVRRRDVLLGCVPALTERLYFFHPLARLAAREYVMAREAACDAAVVRALDLHAHDYGRLLVRLGLASSRSALVASSAAGSASCLRRRLDMLQHISSKATSRLMAATAAAIAFLVLAPVQIVAQRPPAPPALPALPAPPAPLAAPVAAIRALPPLPPLAPQALQAPQAPTAVPVAPAPPAPPSPPDDRDELVQARRMLEDLVRMVEGQAKAGLNVEQHVMVLTRQMAELNRQRDALTQQQRELQRQMAQTNEAIERMKMELRSAAEAARKR